MTRGEERAKPWYAPLTPDEHGHVVMADGWCTQCEGWHHDAPIGARHEYPPDARGGLDALPLGLYVGANRYDNDNTHVLHLWTADGHSFDVMWPISGNPEEQR